jgi:hypothetical protein
MGPPRGTVAALLPTPDLRITSALTVRGIRLVPTVLSPFRYGKFRVNRGHFGLIRG